MPRVHFPVYRIEHDDFDGRLKVRLSFARHPEAIIRRLDSLTGLVACDVMDGGEIGTITAPEGSRLAPTESGGAVLILPDGSGIGIGAEDAVRAAKSPDRNQSLSLDWSPAKE